MNLTELIKHPEHMDRETLYDLRSLIALHPYYQTARLLMLENLYLLHDSTFDEELRRAAIYITDRKVLFNLIEAAHYKLHRDQKQNKTGKESQRTADNQDKDNKDSGSRTAELIDSFLGSLPEPDEEKKPKSRKPSPTDAAVDYVAYLLETEASNGVTFSIEQTDAPQMKGQNLIDDFINKEGGRIVLPELEDDKTDRKDTTTPIPDELYTETMAQIYVRQGRYSQALEIIKRLNLENPKKNAYFADQIRFLEKLIINNKKKNNNNKK